jgi:Fe-S oxidoreductase
MPENYKFGASDIFDLSWKNLMDAYTCTECGRCTSVCPANTTGKLLSPRKIMMDVRDRMEEVGGNLDDQNLDFIRKEKRKADLELTPANYDDGRSLFDFISTEELRACTTCNACVEACPILINPLDIIMELRRNQILEKSESPEAWNVMFSNIDNNRAPWQFAQDDRDKWIHEM